MLESMYLEKRKSSIPLSPIRGNNILLIYKTLH